MKRNKQYNAEHKKPNAKGWENKILYSMFWMFLPWLLRIRNITRNTILCGLKADFYKKTCMNSKQIVVFYNILGGLSAEKTA